MPRYICKLSSVSMVGTLTQRMYLLKGAIKKECMPMSALLTA